MPNAARQMIPGKPGSYWFGRYRLLKPRSALLASVCLLPSLLAMCPSGAVWAQEAPQAAVPAGGVIQAINVTGNKRIETDTITAYMVVQPGDTFDPQRINESLKT